MKDVTEVQRQLIQAIENQADVSEIKALLSKGAVANDVEVMQALERAENIAVANWMEEVLGLPTVADALARRQQADQAAVELLDALEENDLTAVKQALIDMAEAGDDANLDMGDGSMLAVAVTHQCDVAILEWLLGPGKSDLSDFSKDAVEALENTEEGPWKEQVEALFQRHQK